LRFYTAGGAYASFEEDAKGSLSVGKLADVVVLTEDLFAGPPERILGSRVLLTIMDGRIVHRAAGP
jgi:predicted amidohydrolase YtcJ